ncbi:MAG: hypothetical protein WC852_06045, partial [Candidatus Nanoarchaeia archaeon]
MLKKAAAGLALASILSAAPAKADMFDTTPDYSYVNNSAYVESHREESPSEAYARVLEPSAEETQESPFTQAVDLFQMPDLQINDDLRMTVDDYLEANNIEPS